jgi:hypothetical protein
MEDSADDGEMVTILIFIFLVIVFWQIILIGAGLVVLGLVIWGIVYVCTAKKRRIEWEEAEEFDRLQRLRKEEATRQAEQRAHLERHKKTQQGYHQQMITLGEQSLSLFESIPQYLKDTESHLDQAEIDFAERAFAPFWDSIEMAVNTLGFFDKSVCQIKIDLSYYTELIEKYEEVPPEFPLSRQSIEKLAVGTTTAERLKSIARKAQCKIKFAMIYEQRKTNQILVAGFTNLAQALNGMASRITTSIYDLASSVDLMRRAQSESIEAVYLRMDKIAATTIQHHEEIITVTTQHHEQLSKEAFASAHREQQVVEMLDKIQNKRKPSVWDT